MYIYVVETKNLQKLKFQASSTRQKPCSQPEDLTFVRLVYEVYILDMHCTAVLEVFMRFICIFFGTKYLF